MEELLGRGLEELPKLLAGLQGVGHEGLALGVDGVVVVELFAQNTSQVAVYTVANNGVAGV